MNPPFFPLISPMLRQMHSLGRPPGRDWAAVNFEKSGMFTNQPTNQPTNHDHWIDGNIYKKTCFCFSNEICGVRIHFPLIYDGPIFPLIYDGPIWISYDGPYEYLAKKNIVINPRTRMIWSKHGWDMVEILRINQPFMM